MVFETARMETAIPLLVCPRCLSSVHQQLVKLRIGNKRDNAAISVTLAPSEGAGLSAECESPKVDHRYPPLPPAPGKFFLVLIREPINAA